MPPNPYVQASAQAGYFQSVTFLTPSTAPRVQKKCPPSHTHPPSPQGPIQLYLAALLSMNPSLKITKQIQFQRRSH
jgi:hypothetical protein